MFSQRLMLKLKGCAHTEVDTGLILHSPAFTVHYICYRGQTFTNELCTCRKQCRKQMLNRTSSDTCLLNNSSERWGWIKESLNLWFWQKNKCIIVDALMWVLQVDVSWEELKNCFFICVCRNTIPSCDWFTLICFHRCRNTQTHPSLLTGTLKENKLLIKLKKKRSPVMIVANLKEPVFVNKPD